MDFVVYQKPHADSLLSASTTHDMRTKESYKLFNTAYEL